MTYRVARATSRGYLIYCSDFPSHPLLIVSSTFPAWTSTLFLHLRIPHSVHNYRLASIRPSSNSNLLGPKQLDSRQPTQHQQVNHNNIRASSARVLPPHTSSLPFHVNSLIPTSKATKAKGRHFCPQEEHTHQLRLSLLSAIPP